jgi:hypothetical protein
VQLLAVTLESHIEVHCHPFRDKHEEDRNGPVIPASGLDETLCITHNLPSTARNNHRRGYPAAESLSPLAARPPKTVPDDSCVRGLPSAATLFDALACGTIAIARTREKNDDITLENLNHEKQYHVHQRQINMSRYHSRALIGGGIDGMDGRGAPDALEMVSSVNSSATVGWMPTVSSRS